MTTTEIQASGCYYLITKGASAAKWASGAPRKGVRDGNDNQSVVIFPAGEIASAISGGTLAGADLVLQRDTEYGENAVIVTIAPMYTQTVTDGYVLRGEALEEAQRVLHHNESAEGSQAVLELPGATLMELAAGRANAFLLYQEEDGSESYVRFTGTPVLRLHVGDNWMEPIWTRDISKGNVISSKIYSHQADLKELQYYINRFRVRKELAPMADQTEVIESGSYDQWGSILTAMVSAVNEALDEGKDPIQWTAPSPKRMPEAGVIGEIRNAMAGDSSAGIREATSCFTGTMSKAGAAIDYELTTDQVQAGTYSLGGGSHSYITPGGSQTVNYTIKGYRCGGWLFDGSGLAGVTTAKVQITVEKKNKSDEVAVTLYGLKKAPAIGDRYNAVMDAVVAGEGTCVKGEETKITLTAAAIAALVNGTYVGFGIGWKNVNVTCSASAKLLTGEAAMMMGI